MRADSGFYMAGRPLLHHRQARPPRSPDAPYRQPIDTLAPSDRIASMKTLPKMQGRQAPPGASLEPGPQCGRTGHRRRPERPAGPDKPVSAPQVVVAGFSLGGADPGAGPGIGFCALRAGSTAGSIRPWGCSRTTPRAFVLTMSQPSSGWSMSGSPYGPYGHSAACSLCWSISCKSSYGPTPN